MTKKKTIVRNFGKFDQEIYTEVLYVPVKIFIILVRAYLFHYLKRMKKWEKLIKAN